ncbi:MAG TPA: ThuA domain-containing protein [Tepidisphaeraceae bacterium]|jgi:type 1 glutamine amidotransferase|nr:ThuA domain-containing protein [Tepidisphaeraceae bacterium]
MRTAIFLCMVLAATIIVSAADPPKEQPKPQPHVNVAPPPRSRAEVEAILNKAPKTDQPLRHLNILLVAGPKDHGPGEHDYPRWQKEWAPLMSKADNVKITTAFPWPTSDQWTGVDLAVFYLKTKWDASQLADIKSLQDRGAGIVTIHWAIGCDQEWDNHANRFGLSYRAASFRHGKVNLKLTDKEHPILLGLPPAMQFVDEPYWPFIGDKSKVNVLATSDEMIQRGDDRSKNPGDDRVESIPVFWACEPADSKGRVFVSIFGHYMWTFDDPFFRLMLLRGMGWAAKDNPYRFDSLSIDGVELAK